MLLPIEAGLVVERRVPLARGDVNDRPNAAPLSPALVRFAPLLLMLAGTV